MSRDTQIEEMAKSICDIQCNGMKCNECDTCCEYRMQAIALYNAGYRKVSDVVRDIFNDLNEMWHKGRGFINYSDLVRLERLYEQKYESEENKI